MSNKQINAIKRYLKDFGTKKYNPKIWRKYLGQCIYLKELYIQDADFENAKTCLIFESVLHLHHKYLKYHKLIAKNKHEKAWSHMIDVENIIELIKPYLLNEFHLYKIDIIADKNIKLQTLFPYNVFMSTGFGIKNYKCSICDEIISVRSRCKHKKGQIYEGKWCKWASGDITKADHVAIVENPKDKRCIIHSVGGNRLDFSLVDEFINNVRSPYLNWDLRWTKIRHPHEYFKDIKESDLCPCESGIPYKDCCLKESGVLRPHVDFSLESGFNSKPMGIKYLYSGQKQPKVGKERTVNGVMFAI